MSDRSLWSPYQDGAERGRDAIDRAAHWRRLVDSLTYKVDYRVEFVDDGWHHVLNVKVKTFDTYATGPAEYRSPQSAFLVNHRTPLPDFWIDYTWGRRIIRSVIHNVEMHEADEWIRFDGEMVFDPHREDRR